MKKLSSTEAELKKKKALLIKNVYLFKMYLIDFI